MARDGTGRREWTPRPDQPMLFAGALEGCVPADELTTRDRELLVQRLVLAGWNEVRIAEHTRMPYGVVARIRQRIFSSSRGMESK